jgi:pilus assembly protein FimV
MDRKLVVALSSLVGSMVLSETAQAIGLGDIKLRSALNEPLRAEIKLVQVKDLTENQIIVNLAPPEDFANAHVDREFLLNSLRFRLDLDDPSNPKVVVTTQQPIREPFLNFLVEIQWPSGRLLREYTLLMDLPTYAETPVSSGFEAPIATETRVVHRAKKNRAVEPAAEPVRAIEPSVTAPSHTAKKAKESAAAPPAPSPAPQSATAVAEQTKPALVEKANSPEPSAHSYGPTRTNDTLWRIARSVRGSGSIQQKLLAIQRLNPEAFNRNNVNLLKTGKVLRLPSQEEITSIGRAEALVKMKEQEAAWKSGVSLPPPAGAQVDATGRVQPPVVVAPPAEGQLKLATPAPAEVTDSKATQSAGDQDAAGRAADISALKNDLAVNMEELNRVQRENQDVSSRIKDIDAQKASADKLLELQSGELAALQAKLAAERQAKAAADAAAEPVAANPAETTAAPTPATPTPAEQPPQQATTEPPQAAVAAPPAPSAEPNPAPAPAPAQPEPSLQDRLMANPAIAGAVAVILMLLALVGYRKRATSRTADEADEVEEADIEPSISIEKVDDEEAEWHIDDAMESLQKDVQPIDLPDETLAEVIAPEPVLQSESGDVLGEADIYISFGNYDKGEALLKSAISTEPQRADYRLKLLELHKEAGNLAGFDKAYKELIDLDDDAAIAKAGALRAAIPGAADTPFAFGVTSAAAEAGISDEPDFDLDFDLDAMLEPPAAEAPVQTPAPEPEPEPVLDLDEMDFAAQPEEQFDVSFDLDDAADVAELQAVDVAQPAAVAEADPVAEDGAFDLDFDLDLTASAAEPEPEFDLADITAPAAPELDAESTAMLGAVTADAGEIDEELGFLSDADEAATKLDLARAYIDMGDKDGARDILAEVLDEGRDEQKREAQALLDSIS